MVADPSLARNLVEMGVGDAPAVANLKTLFGDVAAGAAYLGAHFNTGRFLRNIATSGRRIEALVKSLKNYARPDPDEGQWCHVREGLEETLLILQHRTKQVTVEKDYRPAPQVFGFPYQLNQVWTNLVTNALDAMEGASVATKIRSPRLMISVGPDAGGGLWLKLLTMGQVSPPRSSGVSLS